MKQTASEGVLFIIDEHEPQHLVLSTWIHEPWIHDASGLKLPDVPESPAASPDKVKEKTSPTQKPLTVFPPRVEQAALFSARAGSLRIAFYKLHSNFIQFINLLFIVNIKPKQWTSINKEWLWCGIGE